MERLQHHSLQLTTALIAGGTAITQRKLYNLALHSSYYVGEGEDEERRGGGKVEERWRRCWAGEVGKPGAKDKH